ncbi:MAG: hypothetical protein JW900_07235 [Anaerolineae bacterium]|nr:hypothetical protein [Anaerolineae bacterium]
MDRRQSTVRFPEHIWAMVDDLAQRYGTKTSALIVAVERTHREDIVNEEWPIEWRMTGGLNIRGRYEGEGLDRHYVPDDLWEQHWHLIEAERPVLLAYRQLIETNFEELAADAGYKVQWGPVVPNVLLIDAHLPTTKWPTHATIKGWADEALRRAWKAMHQALNESYDRLRYGTQDGEE